MRLIDADELVALLDKALSETKGDTPITDATLVAVRDAVKGMPTIDAAPIVRCKDCIHNDKENCDDGWTWCLLKHTAKREDEYCHKGERDETD